MSTIVRPAERPDTSGTGDAADVIFVLVLLQIAAGLLAALGEVLLMGGNPAYLLVPAVKTVVLALLATKVVSARRWAVIALIVVEGYTLAGFGLGLAAGVLPWVDFTVNLVGLLTTVALPLTVIYLCATRLRPTWSARARPPSAPASAVMAPAAMAPPVAVGQP